MDSIHPSTRIGHVHLKVSDLKRAVQFYTDVLGFQVTTQIGTSAVFLSAGGYPSSYRIKHLGKQGRHAAFSS